MKLTIDYETRSEADLKKVGAVTYAQHPSTEVMCVGYKVDTWPRKLWLPWKREAPRDLIECFMEAKPGTLIAHNALFEQVITKWVLPRYGVNLNLPPPLWKCTAAKAAACALPRDLEGAGLALKLPVQKNMEGRRLMLKHSKPRPQWKKSGKGNKYFEDPEERRKIYDYCMDDVEVESLLDERLPDLTEFEQRVWILNQEMNLRGVCVDVPTVKKILGWINTETDRLHTLLREITKGRVSTANQRDEMISWIRDMGIEVPNLQAETVRLMLEQLNGKTGPRAEKVRQVLEIRQQVGKSSLKKYPAMLKRVSRDGRVKDYSMYHGASTGREAGRGLQLQNLVKGKIKDTDLAIEMIKTSTLDEIRLLYGDPFEVFSSCVRGMITASPGRELFVADYNAIEARVLQWIAGDEPGLERFRKKIDSYVLMASKIFGVPVERVTPMMREIGKRAELGCGFGMGGPKFTSTCHQFGATDVTEELGARAVRIYRETHPKVVELWANLERAAIAAVRSPGKVFKINRTAWQVKDGFLWCRLPSGRKLAFYKPTVRLEPAPWGEEFPRLYHWGSNPKTRQWENASTYGGKLTENIVQATARDIMVSATLRCASKGYMFLFSVHDEIISDSKDGTLSEYENLLTVLPEWADGLPITAKGWQGPRYAKR